jgi:hypothetical protein
MHRCQHSFKKSFKSISCLRRIHSASKKFPMLASPRLCLDIFFQIYESTYLSINIGIDIAYGSHWGVRFDHRYSINKLLMLWFFHKLDYFWHYSSGAASLPTLLAKWVGCQYIWSLWRFFEQTSADCLACLAGVYHQSTYVLCPIFRYICFVLFLAVWLVCIQ